MFLCWSPAPYFSTRIWPLRPRTPGNRVLLRKIGFCLRSDRPLSDCSMTSSSLVCRWISRYWKTLQRWYRLLTWTERLMFLEWLAWLLQFLLLPCLSFSGWGDLRWFASWCTFQPLTSKNQGTRVSLLGFSIPWKRLAILPWSCCSWLGQIT